MSYHSLPKKIIQLALLVVVFWCILLDASAHATISTPSAEERFNISQVTLKSNVSFFVGSIHRDWCFLVEKEQVSVIENSLLKFEHSKPCIFVDVGMNDGFYSNMAAAFGCQVYAFELQRKCIEFSRQVAIRNGFENLLNILHLLVSSKNNEAIGIQYPKQDYCDGGFSMSGPRKEQRSHTRAPLIVNATYHAVALDSFLPRSTVIDFLKIDTEGHETEVLRGSLQLFREHRIHKAAVELGPVIAYNNFTTLIDTYKTIVSYNYSITTLNCNPKRGENDVYTDRNFEDFVAFAFLSDSLWRCSDVLLQLR